MPGDGTPSCWPPCATYAGVRTTETEIRRLLSSVNGSPVRITSTRFARLWDPPLNVNMAILHMRDLMMNPPAGYVIEEVEGRKLVLEIRRAP